MGSSIDSLPLEERARHYRECALEAFKLAEAARTPELKRTYLQVATGWHTMALELEPEGIRVSAVSPGFTKTALNNFMGTETVEQGAREAVRVALLGPDAPTGTFTRWEGETIPW